MQRRRRRRGRAEGSAPSRQDVAEPAQVLAVRHRRGHLQPSSILLPTPPRQVDGCPQGCRAERQQQQGRRPSAAPCRTRLHGCQQQLVQPLLVQLVGCHAV